MWAKQMGASGRAVVMDVNGTSNDLANAMIKRYREFEAPKPRTFIFCLQRSTFMCPSFNAGEFLVTLEAVADGQINTTKYKSSALSLPRPFVVVVSNDAIPQAWITNQMLTADRWKTYTIPPLTELDHEKIRTYEESLANATGLPIAPIPGFV